MTEFRVALLLLALACVSATSTENARAQQAIAETYRLDFAATPPDCPPVDDLILRFAERLGRDPFDPISRGRLEIRVSRSERGLLGTIRSIDASGNETRSRRLAPRTRSCSSLVDALVAIGAVWLDPVIDEVPAPSAPESVPESPTTVVVPVEEADDESHDVVVLDASPSRVEAPPVAIEPSRRVRAFARASVNVGLGSMTAPTLGATLGSGIQIGAWSVGAEVGLERRPAADPLHLVRLRLAVPACWTVGRISSCTGPELQLVRADLRGTQAVGDRIAFAAAWFARAEVSLRMGRARPTIFVEPAIALRRAGVEDDVLARTDEWWAVRLGFAIRLANHAREGSSSD